MNTYIFVPFISGVLALALGSLVLILDRKKTLNILFVFLCVLTAYHSFTEFLCRVSPDPASALFWARAGSLWCFEVGVSLHFILLFTGKKKFLASPPAYPLIYVPALVFSLLQVTGESLLQGVSLSRFGYSPLYALDTAASAVISVYMAVVGIFVFTLAAAHYLKVTGRTKKKQALYIAIGFFMPVLAGYVVHGLPLAGKGGYSAAPVATFAIAVQCLFIGYAVWRYKLFSLDPSTAAQNIVSVMPDGLLLAGTDGNILRANPALERLLGYGERELIGRPAGTVFADRNFLAAETAEILRTLKPRSFDAVAASAAGKEIPVNVCGSVITDGNGEPAGVIFIARDMRDRIADEREKRDLQLRLIYASKMASMEQLAMGIAHEINNPLTVILGNIQLLQARFKSDATAGECLSAAADAAQRCKKAVAVLRDIYQASASESDETHDINGIIDHALEFLTLQGTFMTVKLEKNFGDLPGLRLNYANIEQAFMNIIMNAVEAMSGEGTLAIETRSAPGRIELAFRDSGCGMEPAVLDRVFEPFFTTKQFGKGLGLAISQSIVRHYGGAITAESPGRGKGAVVTVTLPLAPPAYETKKDIL